MKEIGIGETIVFMRRKKGMTQSELAEYFGVTKASVSKWETGSSYPDILLLPKMAAFFQISIDELMCYTPQMTEEDIQGTYAKLREEFGVKPFDEVIKECEEIIKRYYCCLPLLLQMAILYLNHFMLAKDKEQSEAVLNSAMTLCERVRAEGEDFNMVKEALLIQSTACHLLGRPKEVLDLLGEEIRPQYMEASLIVSSFQMLGNTKKAVQLTQIHLYAHINDLIEIMTKYLQLCQNDRKKTDEIVKHCKGVIQTFNAEGVFANAAVRFYFQAAVVFMEQNRKKEALEMLRLYTEIGVLELVEISLHGDTFLDELDGWFQEMDCTTSPPRSQKTINADLLAGLCSIELFSELQEEKQYQNLIEKLRSAIK